MNMKKIQKLANITLILLTAILTLPIRTATAQSNNSMVRLVYFLPKDRSPRPDRVRALRQTIKDAQGFYADEMERHGFGRKTFNIETNKNGNPVVHHVYGKFNENYYYNGFTGLEVWKEFFEHADDLQHIYFFAIDLSNDMLSSGNTCGTGGVNYFSQSRDTVPNVVGPGPLAMRYSNETQGEEVLGGAVAIPASGSCYERIGLTLHELGHAFGLQHDFREGINNGYVMSYAHTKKRLSECAAEWLSVSRFFNTNPKPNNSPGSIQLISKPRYNSDGISIRFKVTDADGLHQAQLLGAEMTEQGSWKDDKLFDCKQLNGKTSTIEFISQTLTIEPVDNIMLQIIDVNGNITWTTFLTDIASVLPRPKVVKIPDKNLAAALQKALGLGANATITKQAMRKLTRLVASDRQIRDLTGLAHATELTDLDLGSNQITNFGPLAELPKLRKLYLWGNEISDLSMLPTLPKLEFLDLNWNHVSDVGPLAGFTSLKELWLQGNKLADTSTLFELRGGIFPAHEMVKIVKERGNGGRAYTLLKFRSLGLQVRVNPDVKVYRSLNVLENARKPVEKTEPTTSESVDASVPTTDDIVETKKIPATDAMVSISPSSMVSPAIGEQLTLNLNIAGGKSVAGYQLTLQFDPTALRYVESINSDYLPTGASFVPPVVNRGSVELAATVLTGDSNGDGTLTIVTFEVLTVKVSTLTLSDILLVNSQGNTFLPQVEAGEITEPPELKTDVTGDGVVNILDLVFVANALGTDAPDLNGDGVVNVLDLVIVANAF